MKKALSIVAITIMLATSAFAQTTTTPAPAAPSAPAQQVQPTPAPVPTTQAAPTTTKAPSGMATGAQVDINTADAATIAASTLGLGPVKSKAIIDERTMRGPFKDGADLAARVSGIGPRTLERNPNIVFGQTGTPAASNQAAPAAGTPATPAPAAPAPAAPAQ